MSLNELEPVVGLRGKDGAGIGDQRIRLLEAIDRSGSISAAARAVGITYKAAWDAVAAVNNLAERPLVLGRTGGRAGGGATLTEDGRRFLRSMQILQHELRRMARYVSPDLGTDVVLPSLSWRYLMRTSARNMLLSRVIEVKSGTVNAEVALELTDGVRLIAIITAESVRTLELVPGREVFALVKSSFVLLAPEGEAGRTSARNVLPGTVVRREDGVVDSEILLDIGGGKTLTAVITRESAANLDFHVGSRVCALIKASHVILAVD